MSVQTREWCFYCQSLCDHTEFRCRAKKAAAKKARSEAFFAQMHERRAYEKSRNLFEKQCAAAQKIVAAFNEKVPIGTIVEYEEVLDCTGKFKSKTRSAAWAMSTNPVVMIEGRAGGVSIDHITGWF